MHTTSSFDTTALRIRLKAAEDKVKAFESGDRYVQLKEQAKSVQKELEKKIRQLEYELSEAHAQTVDVREKWFEIYDDVYREANEGKFALRKEIARLNACITEVERQRDEALDKLRDKNQELYDVKIQLDEAEQKLSGLKAQINRDYTNSSKSSSQSPNHKKISNSREKSGKKPGGQKGHIHNPRKRMEPTQTVPIPAPEKYVNNPDFKATGREIRKQLIRLSIGVEVIEYTTPEFRNQSTGQRVHADFPKGINDDVTYDGTIKALAYLLNNECYVGIEKTHTFIKEITGGKVNLSTGLICNLSKQFSEKTKEERNEIFLKLFSSPSMHSDFTFGRMNGNQTAVIICASGDNVLYQGRSSKGDKGVKGSPLEFYEGSLISDHEAALIKHGSKNQECMTHVKRYVISSIENEKDLTWNSMMKEWIDDAVSYWKNVNNGSPEDAKEVGKLEQRYDEIIETAKSEYEYEPPSDYYKDGYNLYKRMAEGKEKYLLFLHDISIEPDNNLAERCARKFKRKAAQVMCFRSQNGVDWFCDGLSVTQSIKAIGKNLYESVADHFNTGLEV
jgi:predicted  nucleic acid-binding Zn-ribbon protein